MFKRIKERLEYRKNIKIVKKEIAAIVATTLPLIHTITSKSADITNFVTRLATETKNVEGEQLIQMVLDNVSDILNTDNNRIVEILTYLAGLTPEDIQKIIVHSVTETIQE